MTLALVMRREVDALVTIALSALNTIYKHNSHYKHIAITETSTNENMNAICRFNITNTLSMFLWLYSICMMPWFNF